MTAIYRNVKSSTGNVEDWEVNLANDCFQRAAQHTIIYNFTLDIRTVIVLPYRFKCDVGCFALPKGHCAGLVLHGPLMGQKANGNGFLMT